MHATSVQVNQATCCSLNKYECFSTLCAKVTQNTAHCLIDICVQTIYASQSQGLEWNHMYVWGYHIMQIVYGGKLSQSQRLVEICGKTFAVVSFMQYLID